MRIGKWVVALAIGLALSTAAFAADGWERDSAFNKLYAPKSLITFTGKVTSVDRNFVPMAGMTPGFMAVIKTDKESLPIIIGPAWFTGFYHDKWNIQNGDTVKTTGSRVKIKGKDYVIVSAGEKGKLKLTVRGKTGIPLWDLKPEDF